jgi:hypothetical protein
MHVLLNSIAVLGTALSRADAPDVLEPLFAPAIRPWLIGVVLASWGIFGWALLRIARHGRRADASRRTPADAGKPLAA